MRGIEIEDLFQGMAGMMIAETVDLQTDPEVGQDQEVGHEGVWCAHTGLDQEHQGQGLQCQDPDQGHQDQGHQDQDLGRHDQGQGA